MSTILELIILLALILLNGLLAMTEIAVVSAKKPRLQSKAESGDTSAQLALKLAEQPNRLLATIQLGISLISIIAGAFGGASFADEISVVLVDLPLVGNYHEFLGFALVVVSITYFSLLFGELVPKRLGLNQAEQIAMLMARPMQLLARLTAPLVIFLSASTNLMIRLLRIQPNTTPPITEDELRVLVAEGTHVGVFDPVEQDLVLQVFQLDESRITELMTPRPNIVWLNREDELSTINRILHESGFSYFPVYQDIKSDPIGIVSAKKLWGQIIMQEAIDWDTLLSPILYVPETTTALQMMQIFRREKRGVALVIDEYGAIQGLISLTDIMQAILGNILPELTHAPQIFERNATSWLVDGMVSIEAFEDYFAIDPLPHDSKDDFHTLAGFVLAYLERIPTEGDSFEYSGFCFEVVDMDGKRIDKLLLTKQNVPK